RPPGEDEKGGLESVFGIMMIPQNPAADAPDHRAMTPHQRFQKDTLLAGDKVLQELSVRQPGDRTRLEERLKVVDCCTHTAFLRLGPVSVGLYSFITRSRAGSYSFLSLLDFSTALQACSRVRQKAGDGSTARFLANPAAS